MTRTTAYFPEFSKLDSSHKNEVEFITSRFEPYSDFNFTSLYSWNINGTTELSILNGNLVLKIPDYITAELIFSVVGDNRIDETLETLFTMSDKLRLVPEIVVKSIKDKDKYRIVEDRDSFDYIYDLKNLSGFEGRRYKWKRKRLKRFEASYAQRLSLGVVNINSRESRRELHTVFDNWAKERKKQEKDVIHEKNAIENLLGNSLAFKLVALELRLDGELVGFSINEQLANDYAICHFQKSILDYQNIDIYLSNQTAKKMLDLGCKYINWEQDLGLEGLRKQKMSYAPVRWLKKYTLQPKKSRLSL